MKIENEGVSQVGEPASAEREELARDLREHADRPIDDNLKYIQRADELMRAAAAELERASLLPSSVPAPADGETIQTYFARQIEWSRNTFGPGLRTGGVLDHIRKELNEIEAEPHDLSEWIDVVILAMDGFWRHGGTADDLLPRLLAKQQKNMARTWPDWRTMSEDRAIEHDRSGDAPACSAPADGWCQPMRNGEHEPRKFVVLFDDPDKGMSVFDNEAEARDFWEQANISWNCYLLGALPRSASPSQPVADAVVEAVIAKHNPRKADIPQTGSIPFGVVAQAFDEFVAELRAALQPSPAAQPEAEARESLSDAEARILQEYRWGNLTKLGVANHLRRAGFKHHVAVDKANALEAHPTPDTDAAQATGGRHDLARKLEYDAMLDRLAPTPSAGEV